MPNAGFRISHAPLRLATKLVRLRMAAMLDYTIAQEGTHDPRQHQGRLVDCRKRTQSCKSAGGT